MYVSLFFGIVCTSIIYTSQRYQNVSEHYQIIHKISDGLKSYAQFTGRQFLIINHDPFDWVDVTVAVNARIREDQVVAEFVASNEIIFAVPQISAGELYTLQTNQLTVQARLSSAAVARRAAARRRNVMPEPVVTAHVSR